MLIRPIFTLLIFVLLFFFNASFALVILEIQLTLFSEFLNHSVTPTVSHLPASFMLITSSKLYFKYGKRNLTPKAER